VTKPPFGSALLVGFLLSFLAMGLLWVAMAWQVQALMVLAFAAVAYRFSRRSGSPRRMAQWMLVGAAPLGLLFVQFRDREGSHLLPIAMVALWALGTAAGAVLGARSLGRAAPADQAGE
jgi:hypothetical protein